jgi:asparagine synthase (glutamine-hydrolysing)
VHLMDRLRQRPPAIGAPSESWRRMRWRIESGEEAIALGHLDRLGSATGVELRHPFYDRRLVELSFMIPPGAHLADRSDRSVMRRAMRDRLPAEIAARTSKADLTRLLVHAARHPGVARHRGLASLAEAGWIRPDAAAAIVSRTIDAGDVDAAPLFWRLIGVEAWLNRAFQAR